MNKHKVILAHCDGYNAANIANIIGSGMDALGARPIGRTMVKPNVVTAHNRLNPHAYTRPEFLDGLLTALRVRGSEMARLSVGEKCGIKIPTRYAFAMAGYPAVLRKHRVQADYFDEGPEVRVDLAQPDALRRFILVPKAVSDCDFLVNAPKFKAHPWTKVTFSLKNYIGIQTDAQRLIDHDHRLHTKIVDLQEVISPGFIAIDGITAGEHTMTTPSPFPLHLIIMGMNPVAVDAVSSHIVGLDPQDVDHIRIASERGYGPMNLEGIDICGDVGLAEAKQRAAGFRLTLERVDEIFNGRSNITVYAGPPPDTYDYCWGGCPGAFFEAVEMIKLAQPDVYHEVLPLHVVFGAYKGEIRAQPGEPVLFLGDCTTWQGVICGQDMRVPFCYTPRQQLNPYQMTHKDVPATLASTINQIRQSRGWPALRVKGCPVSTWENVLLVSRLGKTKNPYTAPSVMLPFFFHWVIARTRRTMRSFGRHETAH